MIRIYYHFVMRLSRGENGGDINMIRVNDLGRCSCVYVCVCVCMCVRMCVYVCACMCMCVQA